MQRAPAALCTLCTRNRVVISNLRASFLCSTVEPTIDFLTTDLRFLPRGLTYGVITELSRLSVSGSLFVLELSATLEGFCFSLRSAFHLPSIAFCHSSSFESVFTWSLERIPSSRSMCISHCDRLPKFVPTPRPIRSRSMNERLFRTFFLRTALTMSCANSSVSSREATN